MTARPARPHPSSRTEIATPNALGSPARGAFLLWVRLPALPPRLMLCRMRNPPKEPPEEQREPFLAHRTPPMGTLLGLQRPALLPLPPARPAAGIELAAPPARPQGAAREPANELERHAEGLRVELVYFRKWLPGQLDRLTQAPAAVAAPSSPPVPGRRRELARECLMVGAGAALGIALASAAAVLGWPPYGALVAGAARLGAPSAASSTR